MVKQAKTQKKPPNKSPAASCVVPKPPAKANLDLFMECVDEDLTPSQMEANRKAANEYNSAVKQIEIVSRRPPIVPTLPVKRSESPDVIVVDDDEPEIIAASSMQYCGPVLNTRGPGTLVIRGPVNPTGSNVCAPVIPPSSTTSVAAPRMFITLPPSASNRPLLLPAGFTQLRILGPVGSSSSAFSNNFGSFTTLPALSLSQPMPIVPGPLRLTQPPVASNVWSSAVNQTLSAVSYQGRNCQTEVQHRSTGTSPIPLERLERQESPSPELDDSEDFYYDDEMASQSVCDKVKVKNRKGKRRRRRGSHKFTPALPTAITHSAGVKRQLTSNASQDVSSEFPEHKRLRTTPAAVSNLLSHQTRNISSCGSSKPDLIDTSPVGYYKPVSSEQTGTAATPLSSRRSKNHHAQPEPSSESLFYNNSSTENAAQPYILNVWSERDGLFSSQSSIDQQRKVSRIARGETPANKPSVTPKAGQPAVKHAVLSVTEPLQPSPQSKLMALRKKSTVNQAKNIPSKSGEVLNLPFETRSGKKWLNTQFTKVNAFSRVKTSRRQLLTLKNSSCASLAPFIDNTSGIKTRSGRVGARVSQSVSTSNVQHGEVSRSQSDSNCFSGELADNSAAKKSEKANQSMMSIRQIPSAIIQKQSKGRLVLKLKKRRHRFSVQRATSSEPIKTASVIVSEKLTTVALPESFKVPLSDSSSRRTRSSAEFKPVPISEQSQNDTRVGSFSKLSNVRVDIKKMLLTVPGMKVGANADKSETGAKKNFKVLSRDSVKRNMAELPALPVSINKPAINNVLKTRLPLRHHVTDVATSQGKRNLAAHTLQTRMMKQTLSKQDKCKKSTMSVNEKYSNERRKSGRLSVPELSQEDSRVSKLSKTEAATKEKERVVIDSRDKNELSVATRSKQICLNSNDSTLQLKQTAGKKIVNASVECGKSNFRTSCKVDMWKKYGFKQSSLYKSMALKDQCKGIPSDVGLRSVEECINALDKNLAELEKNKLSKKCERVQQLRKRARHSMQVKVKSGMQSRLIQSRMHTRTASSLPGGIRQQLDNSLQTQTSVADATLTLSGSAKKTLPPNDLHLDSVLESVARGVQGTVKKRGRPPKVIAQKEKSQLIEHTIITIDDAEDNPVSDWVPLDEYYYGRKEGNPSYQEEKGDFKFKCWYCNKILYNNIRLMSHVQGHIDSEKQPNLDLVDLTQCTHCYQQFGTPFEMQCHVEKVHQNQSSILLCHICEKDFKNEVALRQHMKQKHKACEMPYICQLCGFRSSVYNDVVDHFKKRHDSSSTLLCLYCLKTFKTYCFKNVGYSATSHYYQHLQKHLAKGVSQNCHCCKLTFHSKSEMSQHVLKDHAPNFRGVLGTKQSANDSSFKLDTVVGSSSASELVMIPLPQTSKVKLLNAPTLSLNVDMIGLHLCGVETSHRCLECGQAMDTAGHYQKYLACTMCRFATVCGDAYLNHMARFHRGKAQVQVEGVLSDSRKRRNTQMHGPTYCLCGFSSCFGAVIANHLVSCSKRTCYTNMPEQKWLECDDDHDEHNTFKTYGKESDAQSPERDIPTLFGALGLVKKARRTGHTKYRSRSPQVSEVNPSSIAKEVIEDILDVIFPAEKAASEILSALLDGVDKVIKSREIKRTRKNRMTSTPTAPCDKVPAELTGSRKWSTVKMSDEVIPSLSSIFLGSEVEEKMDVDPDSTTAKAEESKEKPDSANISIIKIYSDIENDLVPEKELQPVMSADQCNEMESAEESKNDSDSAQLVSEMNECTSGPVSNTNYVIGCVTKSTELGTVELDSGFSCSRLDNVEEIGASLVSEGISDLTKHENVLTASITSVAFTDVVTHCDDHVTPNEASVALTDDDTHVTSNEASVALTDDVTPLDDYVKSNKDSLALTDLVTHLDDFVTSKEAAVALTDVVALLDDHPATNEALVELSDVVMHLDDRALTSEVPVELTDVAHLKDHATSNDVAETNLFTRVDDHVVSNDASVEQSDAFESINSNFMSEQQLTSNVVSLEHQETGSSDVHAVEATDMNKSDCDMAILSEKASQLIDGDELSEKSAKCFSADSITEIFNNGTTELLTYENSMKSGIVSDSCESEFLDGGGVRENTTFEFVDELIPVPVTNAIDQQLTVNEDFVKHANVLAESCSIVNSTGTRESPLSGFPDEMTKTEAVTDVAHYQKLKKCDVSPRNELEKSVTVTLEMEAGDSVANIVDETVSEELTDVGDQIDSNTDISLSSGVQLQKDCEESGKQMARKSTGNDEHNLTTANNADDAEQVNSEVLPALYSFDETESSIHFSPSVCETIGVQDSILPAAELHEPATDLKSTSVCLGSTSQESSTTPQNLERATDHSAANQQIRQRQELVEQKNTEKEDSKNKDLDRKPSESRWEERRDNRPNSYDRRDYDRRNDYRDYQQSQQNWHGGYSQAGYNHAEYGRQNYSGRPHDRWGYQGQDANRRGNYGAQNRGNQGNRYSQHGDDQRYGAYRGGYRGGNNSGAGYYDRR